MANPIPSSLGVLTTSAPSARMSCCFSTENRSGTTNTAFSPNCLAATASRSRCCPRSARRRCHPPHVAAFEHAFEHVLPDAVLDARTGVERLQLRVHRHRVRGVVYPNERRLPDRLQHRRQGLLMGRHVAAIVAGSFVCFHGCVGLPLSPFAVIIAGTLDASFPNSSSGAGDRTNLCPSSGSEEV